MDLISKGEILRKLFVGWIVMGQLPVYALVPQGIEGVKLSGVFFYCFSVIYPYRSYLRIFRRILTCFI